MQFVKALEAPEVANPHKVSVRELLQTEHAQVMLVSLQPGEALKLHITPVDVFFYALEGQGTVEIGGERQQVQPNTLIESPVGIPHRLLNETDQLARFLVVKTPRPSNPTRLL